MNAITPFSALAFPSSPTSGQVYQGWKWDGAKWVPAFSPVVPGLPGDTTGATAAAGMVGELLTANATVTGMATSSYWYEIASLALTPGDWDVSASSYHTYSNTQGGYLSLNNVGGVGVSGGGSTDATVMGTYISGTTPVGNSGWTAVKRSNSASAVTWHAQAMFMFLSSGSASVTAYIFARRRR